MNVPNGNGSLTPEEIRNLRPSLKELVDAKLYGLEKSIDLRFAALEKAVEVAKTTNDFRLDAMNEFRASMSDQSDRFLTKAEHQSWKDNVNSDLRVFRDFMVTVNAKADQKTVMFGIGLSVISTIIAIASIVLKISGK